MSIRVFGFSSYWLWLAVVAVLCTALALGGPILVVRRWLERFGAWVVAGVALWITARALNARGEVLLPVLPHAVELLAGETGEAGHARGRATGS